MDIVTIDFETYYDKDYSLSKITTEAYVRSPQFEVIGVGVKVNNYPTDWYSGENVGKFLNSLDYRDKAILCHHTAFDGAILSWHFNIKPKLWLDTLSMARPLHNMTVGGSLKALATYYGLGQKGTEVLNAIGKRREDFTPEELAKYGEYCVNDVELTYQLFKKLSKDFPISELMVIDQTLRMYTEPVIELDSDILLANLNEVKVRKKNLLDEMGLTGISDETITKTLMSNDIFAKYLINLGIDPPTKVSARTGKQAYAFSKTDKEFTDLLEHPDVKVQTAVAARLGVKSTIEETRTQGLLDVAKRGRLPIMLNYYGAHTGRFSGGDKLNLQNLPAAGRGTNSGNIRRALKAPAGHKIIACDSSQIEARMVAYVAGQQDLVEAFAQGRDVYSEFASEVYGRKITKADKVERFVGKTCILGLGYGMGAEKFRRTLEIGQAGISVKIELHEADRIVRLYRQKNFKITQLWNLCGNALNGIVSGGSGQVTPLVAYDSEGIILPNKLRIRYPALRKTESGFMYIADAREYRKAVEKRVMTGEVSEVNWTKIYGGKVTENLIQALARIVIAEQMATIGQHYHVAFQVHDEIIITAPDAEATDAEKLLVEIMSTPPAWAPGLPVACESGVADNYGDT
jgi:DNA polymerase I-like protein with 3'-5' exonuclease and polymerase domains